MFFNELYHHGRLGQKWGEQNGPPYPLSRSTVRREYGSKRKQRKMEKEVKKLQQQREQEEKERARLAADKSRVLREGTASEVLQYKNELTTKEISDAIDRIKLVNELTSLSAKDTQTAMEKFDKYMRNVKTITGWGRIGADTWNLLVDVYNATEEGKKKPMTRIRNDGGGGNKK